MTRSEEELRVGTTEREAGRVRLKKYVVEDEVTETVPVRREEVRVEREPITDANRGDATAGPEISEEEHEVVLHEEEPVAEKRAVPKERVRLDKDVTTDERRSPRPCARSSSTSTRTGRDTRWADSEGRPRAGPRALLGRWRPPPPAAVRVEVVPDRSAPVFHRLSAGRCWSCAQPGAERDGGLRQPVAVQWSTNWRSRVAKRSGSTRWTKWPSPAHSSSCTSGSHPNRSRSLSVIGRPKTPR